jgi:hypothetical protein
MSRKASRTFLFLLAAVLFLALSLIALRQVAAASEVRRNGASSLLQEATATPDPLSISNQVCLGCHGQPGLTMKLDNGDSLDLYVAPEDYASSIHGQLKYACVQCHRTVGNYPHPAFTAADPRDFTLKMNQACAFCHTAEAELTQDSVHAAAQAQGKREAAVCVDCHGSHSVSQMTDMTTGTLLPKQRIEIPKICANCHYSIYEEYVNSVHGQALTEENNLDVPTCIDCHGVHDIEDPTTTAFRLKSPDLCAKCHTDPVKMAKYGLSTQVLSTYAADFHGTTVIFSEKESPDAQINEAVCYDCHGVHNISRVDDPNTGLDIRQNLLKRCQVCHPDATANFPTAWLSHYIPSPEHSPMVYYVGLFYKFFIPIVLGSMALLVVLDFGSAIYRRSAGKGAKLQAAGEQPAEPPAPPVEAQAPAEIEPSGEAEPAVEQPPAEGQPLAEIEPPAEGPAPVETEAPAESPPAAEIEPPVESPAPVETETAEEKPSAAEIEPKPVESPPAAEIESPPEEPQAPIDPPPSEPGEAEEHPGEEVTHG